MQLYQTEVFNEKVDWVIRQHKETNHFYDGYLPYEFHLKMVYANYLKFYHEIEPFDAKNDYCVFYAAWGHDLIEDARTTYNDVKTQLGETAANIIYALTNEKGKNRKERASDKYYEGIRETEGAVFVKLCDRIANIEYSKITGSRMFKMYESENRDFMYQLRLLQDPANCKSMFEYLTNLFII